MLQVLGARLQEKRRQDGRTTTGISTAMVGVQGWGMVLGVADDEAPAVRGPEGSSRFPSPCSEGPPCSPLLRRWWEGASLAQAGSGEPCGSEGHAGQHCPGLLASWLGTAPSQGGLTAFLFTLRPEPPQVLPFTRPASFLCWKCHPRPCHCLGAWGSHLGFSAVLWKQEVWVGEEHGKG